MVSVEPTKTTPQSGFDFDLAKARRDISALESIAQRDARDLEKRVRLAYRQYHLGSLTGMESDFKPVERSIQAIIGDFGPKEDVCLLQANLASRFHQLDKAKNALEICPTLARRPAGRSVLAEIDFQEGRYDQAELAWQTLIDEHCTWDNLARLAHLKFKMGEINEADRLYEKAEDALTAKELRSFAWIELQRGKMSIIHGHYPQARSHYERARAAYPGDWHTDQHWVELLAAESQFDEAVTLLKNVIDRAPKPELQQAMGELLTFLGKSEEAKPWFNQALTAYLKSTREGGVHYFHHLADFYAEAGGKPGEAVEWALKDVGLRSNFSTQSALAWAYFQNGQTTEGVECIQLALKSGVQDGGIFATAACLFKASGDTTKGEFYERAATEINPNGHAFHMHV